MEKTKYIKSSEFDGDGVKLVYLRTETYTPEKRDDGMEFGAKHQYGTGGVITKENWLIKNGKLAESDSFKYIFKDEEMEREFDNASVGFWITLDKAKLVEGDSVLIKRNKVSNFDIKWSIEKK